MGYNKVNKSKTLHIFLNKVYAKLRITTSTKEIRISLKRYKLLYDGVLGGFLILVARYVSNRVSERQAMKKKLKHFKPTIHEGVFLTTMSWQERDTPLTDEELKSRY